MSFKALSPSSGSIPLIASAATHPTFNGRSVTGTPDSKSGAALNATVRNRLPGGEYQRREDVPLPRDWEDAQTAKGGEQAREARRLRALSWVDETVSKNWKFIDFEESDDLNLEEEERKGVTSSPPERGTWSRVAKMITRKMIDMR